MSDIQRLIELLKSDNPNKRYDACEELRVSQQPLPPEAIDVLRLITNDPNSDVADAAQRALKLHDPVQIALHVNVGDINKGGKEGIIDQKIPIRTLWQIAFYVNVLTTMLCCSMSFLYLFGLWSCVLPNFPIVFSIVSVIALGASFFIYQRGKIVAAIYLAFVPIIGQLFWILINLGPNGCGVYGWYPFPADTYDYTVNVAMPPAGTVEAIQTNTANIESKWNLVLIETFDSNINKWYEGAEDDENALIVYKVINGKYRWDTTARNYTLKRVLLNDQVRDFYFTADIQNIDGDTSAGEYGLIFRDDGNGNFYYFAAEINGSDCVFFKFQNNEWIAIMDWSHCTALRPYKANKFSVIVNDDQFSLLINDKLIGIFRDAQIKGDRMGIAIRIYSDFDTGTFEFDNIELRVP